MKSRIHFSTLALGLTFTFVFNFSIQAQDTKNFPVIGEIIPLDESFSALLDEDAKIEVISSGYTWSEGPAWNYAENFLAFSDVPLNKVFKWIEGAGASLWIEPSGYTGALDNTKVSGSNGLAFDAEGNMYFCESGDRRISMMKPGEGRITLADNYQGKRFNSPNDIAIASNGVIYFTDPFYGMPKKWRETKRELPYMGVFAIRKDGSVALVDDRLGRPNGIALSPDEKTLYAANSQQENPVVYSYPIKKDGSFGKRSVFFDASKDPALANASPDGMKFDSQGNLWIGGIIGVIVVNPTGNAIGLMKTGERTFNCVFGDDGSTLYLTADTYICRIKTKVKGLGF